MTYMDDIKCVQSHLDSCPPPEQANILADLNNVWTTINSTCGNGNIGFSLTQ